MWWDQVRNRSVALMVRHNYTNIARLPTTLDTGCRMRMNIFHKYNNVDLPSVVTGYT